MTEGVVMIREGREKPIRQGHPWVFSGAVDKTQGASSGGIVTLVTHNNAFLARGYWNAKSQIQMRVLTWQDEAIDESWWRRMLARAVTARFPQPQSGVGRRVINAENDYLPGLIVDLYDDFLVFQALTLYIDEQKVMLARLLADVFEEAGMPLRGIYERSDVDVRGKEGLKASVGTLWGAEPPELISFTDNELARLVDVRGGHKTGYYLDQLGNHRLLTALTTGAAADARMLNLFSYSGGFGLGVDGEVVNVDASREALRLAEDTYRANHRPAPTNIQADAFQYLRDAVAAGERFDVIVCDPPKFAHAQQHVDKAARGYKDLNLHCFRLMKAGGWLLTFSCSGAINADLFQKIVFGALADSERQAQVVAHLGPGGDHPVALTFPEGAYLKGLLLRVY